MVASCPLHDGEGTGSFKYGIQTGADNSRLQKMGASGMRARRAGLPTGVHILRHTFCSRLVMRGAASNPIQELAGHQELAVTQRYMHLSPGAADSAIRLLESSTVPTRDGDILETTSERALD
jgi:integrase